MLVAPIGLIVMNLVVEINMSFEKRKNDGFLTIKNKQDILVYLNEPDKLDPIKYASIKKLIGSTWKNYKDYKGV